MGTQASGITVRRATKSDLSQIALLYEDFWNETSDVNRMESKFELMSEDERYCLLVAEKANRIIGTVFGIVCDELYGCCRPFIVMEDLIVSKSEKRNGVGKLLFENLLDFAKEKNCSQIQFITESDRFEAIEFYKSIGFNADRHIGFKAKL